MDAFSPETKTAGWMQSPVLCRAHVSQALAASEISGSVGAIQPDGLHQLSVVLLLIGMDRASPAGPPEPCLILNKRSQQVRQPGDICCPGGGIEPRIDPIIAHLLRLPGSPLKRWPHYLNWQHERPEELRQIRLLLATALREGFEEMRLNPFTVRFLGGLPPEPLVMFHRVIQPLVVWVDWQRHFYPNWEVDQVVKVPITELLNPARYRCYRLTMPARQAGDGYGACLDFPAFRFTTPHGTEILWGATFRITMGFLKRILNFSPPELETLDVIERKLPPHYIKGGRRRS